MGGMLRAKCNLPNNQLSAVNMTLCYKGATLSQANGQLICSSLANGVPSGTRIPCGLNMFHDVFPSESPPLICLIIPF